VNAAAFLQLVLWGWSVASAALGAAASSLPHHSPDAHARVQFCCGLAFSTNAATTPWSWRNVTTRSALNSRPLSNRR
jgi:hypothetical protein